MSKDSREAGRRRNGILLAGSAPFEAIDAGSPGEFKEGVCVVSFHKQ